MVLASSETNDKNKWQCKNCNLIFDYEDRAIATYDFVDEIKTKYGCCPECNSTYITSMRTDWAKNPNFDKRFYEYVK
jgi:rubredoxin